MYATNGHNETKVNMPYIYGTTHRRAIHWRYDVGFPHYGHQYLLGMYSRDDYVGRSHLLSHMSNLNSNLQVRLNRFWRWECIRPRTCLRSLFPFLLLREFVLARSSDDEYYFVRYCYIGELFSKLST